MRRDKKASDGVPRFALLEDIGVPFSAEGAYCTEVPREILRKVLAETANLGSRGVNCLTPPSLEPAGPY